MSLGVDFRREYLQAPFPQLLFHQVQHLQGAAGQTQCILDLLRIAAHAPPIVQRAAAGLVPAAFQNGAG